MPIIRMLFVCALLLCPSLVSLHAADFRLDRLGSWGNDGYRFIEAGPSGPIGVTAHGLEFLSLGEDLQPQVRARVFLSASPLVGVQRVEQHLWLATDEELILVALGDATATVVLRYRPEQGPFLWAANRQFLSFHYGNKMRTYRYNQFGQVDEFSVQNWPGQVTDLAFVGDEELIVQGLREMHSISFKYRAPDRTLEVPEDVLFAKGGLVGGDGELYAVDRKNKRLAVWVRGIYGGWRALQPVSLPYFPGPLQVRAFDPEYLVLGNASGEVRLLERREGQTPALKDWKSRVPHKDLLPLGPQDWLTADDFGVRHWTLGEDGFRVRAQLTQRGVGGAVAAKASVTFWVRDKVLWLFDHSDVFQPKPIKTLPIDAVRDVRVAGDVLAVVAEDLHLYDISDPRNPQRLRTQTRNVRDLDLQDGLLATLIEPSGDGPVGLTLYDLSTPQAPRQLVADEVPGDVQQVALAGSHLFTLSPTTLAHFRWHADTGRLEVLEQITTGSEFLFHEHLAVRDGLVTTYQNDDRFWAYAYDDDSPLRLVSGLNVSNGSEIDSARPAVRDGLFAVGATDLVVVDSLGETLNQVGRLPMVGVVATAWQDDLLIVSGGTTGRLELLRAQRAAQPVYIPWVSNSRDYSSEIVVINDGPLPQTLNLTGFMRDAPTRTVQRVLPGDSVLVLPAETLFPGWGGYSLEIAPEGQKVAAFSRRRTSYRDLVRGAVRRDQLGRDLVFPSFQGKAIWYVLVVTPLGDQSTPYDVRLLQYRGDDDQRAVSRRELKGNQAMVWYLNNGNPDRIRLQADVPLIGQYFQFYGFSGWSEVNGWSAEADSAMRARLTVARHWVNPAAAPWTALAADGDWLAVARENRVVVLRQQADALSEVAVLDGFDEVQALQWGDGFLFVADQRGVVIHELTDAGQVTRRAEMTQTGVATLAVATFPNRRLVVGTAAADGTGLWQLYDWADPSQPQWLTEDHFRVDQGLSFDDGLLTLFSPAGELQVLDVRAAPEVTLLQTVTPPFWVDMLRYQVARSGDQLLSLVPGIGLINLYLPWDPDPADFVMSSCGGADGRDMAVTADAVLVAAGANGLHLHDSTLPFALPCVDALPALPTNLVAASADGWFAADLNNGDLRAFTLGAPVTQLHVPYLGEDPHDLVLQVHQTVAAANHLQLSLGENSATVAAAPPSSYFALGDLLPDSDPTGLSLAAAYPTMAWIEGNYRDTVPAVRDNELGAILIMPLFGNDTPRVTLSHYGFADTVVFKLYRDDGTAVSQTQQLKAVQATTISLATLFDADDLAHAQALRIEADPSMRFSAMLHHEKYPGSIHLVPAVILR